LGGLAGQIAGQIAVQCKLKNRYDSNFLKIYQKKWKKEMYSNLKRMLLVRNYMNNLSDFDVNILFNKLENKGIIQDIENLGHIDNQGVIVKKFMRTLSLYPFYFRTSFKLLKSFF
jgi:flavin-dependent dehydrogenase